MKTCRSKKRREKKRTSKEETNEQEETNGQRRNERARRNERTTREHFFFVKGGWGRRRDRSINFLARAPLSGGVSLLLNFNTA